MSLGKVIAKDLKGDRSIWLIVFFLGILSLLAVYSAVGSMAYTTRDGNTIFYLIQQLIFISIGFFIMWISYRLDYMFYSKLAPILLIISIPLLIYTIGFGTEVNDARRWITIPWIDKTFQTSDFARIALIMFLARSIAKRQENIKDFKSAFIPLLLPVLIVTLLIAPSNLSTALLLFTTSVLMIFIGRIHLKYIFLLFLAGLIFIGLILAISEFLPELSRGETWKNRIQEYALFDDGGYQIQQSKIAIARGEWLGVGPGNSIQRNYLPYPYADFIYAIIVEEYGIIGGLSVLGLYLWLLFRGISIVTRSPKTFGAMLSLGLILNIVIQAFANIAVSVHLLPVTGLTLPLISMGGTSLLITYLSLGIILSVSKYVEKAEKEKIALREIEIRNEQVSPSVEFDQN
ncbi:MAG TPA: cell division protein FtsW [Saprospirales bacterium]|mgnify:CR=1 FL=1|nr:cell division protein FtsW [Saprospirales bacterium]HAY70698.1 cell division protein FtsW [Saprospirales bacterium]HRQ28857.1 FtsW/RodA/SpoVE family cell cycle protein [Saprospiraceae bacterium]